MTGTRFSRALSPSETVHAVNTTWTGFAVHVEGGPDPDALAVAYEALYRGHPHVAAHLRRTDDGSTIVESGPPPVVHVGEGDTSRPLAGLELDQERALSALNVVTDGGCTSVALAMHHSMADARHCLDLVATLWSHYTDVVEGAPPEVSRQAWPRSLEDLLAERGVEGAARLRDRGGTGLPATAPSEDAVVERDVTQLRLTVAETDSLKEAGARAGLTLHSVLSAVALLVEAQVREVPPAELCLRYAVDLRRHLTPPVGPTEGTNVLGGVAFRLAGGAAADAVSIGRAVGDQLRAGLTDGSVQRSLLDMLSRSSAQAPPWAAGAVPVSMMNTGRVPRLRTPAGVRPVGFRCVSARGGGVGAGGYVVTAFDGRLGIDLVWPDTDPDLARRVELLRDRLVR